MLVLTLVVGTAGMASAEPTQSADTFVFQADTPPASAKVPFESITAYATAPESNRVTPLTKTS